MGRAAGSVALPFSVRLLMLMTMMAAGGMGGAVASAIARALGANRQDDAEAIVVHALLVAAVLGLAFSVAALWGGPTLYRAMGGSGRALAAAQPGPIGAQRLATRPRRAADAVNSR